MFRARGEKKERNKTEKTTTTANNVYLFIFLMLIPKMELRKRESVEGKKNMMSTNY